MNHAQNCVQVKCGDLKKAQDTVILYDGQHKMEVNKKMYKVRLQMDDGGVEVKIHDLSENVTKDDIVATLQQYGDVLSIKMQTWSENFVYKTVCSGVWVAKMNLRRHIKCFINVQGEQTLVTYRNQPQTCRHCMNLSHPGSTCVENKKLLGQKADLESRLKRAQASKDLGSRSHTANTDSTSASFATVVSNEAPLAPTPPFVRLVSKDEQCTLHTIHQTPGQQNIPDSPAAICTPSTSAEVTPTMTTQSSERDHDYGMEQSGSGTTTTINTTTINQQKPMSGEQSTQQLQDHEVPANNQQAVKNTTSYDDVSTFKTPVLPTESQNSCSGSKATSSYTIPLSMEISESDSNDSTIENPYRTVKRGGGRSKKKRTDSPVSQTSTNSISKTRHSQ